VLYLNRLRNFSEGNIRGELSSTSHISILSYNLKYHLFSTRFEYYTGTFGPSTASSSFLDAKYSYVPKGKFGLDFSITNLLNKTEFISLASDPYSFTVRRYSLRPRQFLIGARMRF
jgi:outer membrane receptor protein involved in Fe transport